MGLPWSYRPCDNRLCVVKEQHDLGGLLVPCRMSFRSSVFGSCRRHTGLLVAYNHNTSRGFIHLCISTDRPKEIIKWGTRLLYVQVFLSFLVAYGQLFNMQTYLFLGAVFCLVIPTLFIMKDEEETEARV